MNTQNDNEEDRIPTIGEAVILRRETDELVRRRIRWLASSAFLGRIAAELSEHQHDVLGLGPEWGEIHTLFYLSHHPMHPHYRKRKTIKDDIEQMLGKALDGLRQLNGRYAWFNADMLRALPELTYIGLVQACIQDTAQDAAKEDVVKYHVRFSEKARRNRVAEAA